VNDSDAKIAACIGSALGFPFDYAKWSVRTDEEYGPGYLSLENGIDDRYVEIKIDPGSWDIDLVLPSTRPSHVSTRLGSDCGRIESIQDTCRVGTNGVGPDEAMCMAALLGLPGEREAWSVETVGPEHQWMKVTATIQKPDSKGCGGKYSMVFFDRTTGEIIQLFRRASPTHPGCG